MFTQIRRLAPHRMTIVVTHQLENTRPADHTRVMGQGRVIEQGTHEDAVNADGQFTDLVALVNDR